jgi:hypothetical protein
MNEIHSTKRVLGKVIAKTCNVHGKSEQKFQVTNKRNIVLFFNNYDLLVDVYKL